MKQLDTKGNEPSLVKQLYALALLNRDDAMRRLHSGLSPDVQLAQQPPSMLALARPPEGSGSNTFQPPARRIKDPLRSGPRAASTSYSKPRTSRRFGAVITGGGRVDDANHHLNAARARAIPEFRPGYGVPVVHGRLTRAQTANAAQSSSTLSDSGFAASTSASHFVPPSLASSSPSAGLGKQPLRPADLNGLPTRMSHYEPQPLSSPSQRFTRQAVHLAPLPRSTVRALMELPAVRAATPGREPASALKSSAGEQSRRRYEPMSSSFGPNDLAPSASSIDVMGPRSGYNIAAPKPESTFDAWAAAEEDLKYRAEQEQRHEQRRSVNLARELGRDDATAIGF